MNNWFAFQIPYISSQWGSDWSSFTTITDDNVDYVMDKTFELYWLKDFGRMPAQALEYALKLRDIETTPSEALSVKRSKLRSFSTGYRNKGTADLYLDYAEAITGARGEIFQGYDSGYTDWGVSSWSMGLSEANARVWETPSVVYKVYVEPKVEEPGQAAMEAIEMYLPLAEDSLDVCGNEHDGTATDIIYSDTPDMRMYLPLTADDDDDSDFSVTTTPTDITYGADGAIFNGTSSKIVTDLVITNLTGWNISFDFKHSASAPSSNENLITNYVDNDNRWAVVLAQTSGYLLFTNRAAGSSATNIQYLSLNLCDGNTHKVSINFISSTTLQIAVDNSADTVKTLTVALADLTAPTLRIGVFVTTLLYAGTMKNIRIFNRNLTTAEITQLYTYNTFTALSKAVAVFNGITSKILIADGITNLSGLCISFRFKKNFISGTNEFLFNFRQGSTNYTRLYLNGANGRLYFYNTVAGVSSTLIASTANYCDGAVHHLILNFIDASTLRIIVDGVVINTYTIDVPLTTFTTPTIYLGVQVSSSFFNGCIGDFILFNRNLTTDEATWIYEHNLDDEFYSKLDDIVDIYRQDFVRPAFYDMYLVNSNMIILRTV